MPVLIPGGSGPRLFTASTPAQAVMNATSQDLRNQLSAVNQPDASVLLDYVNRVSLDLMKVSKWWFLLSPVQQFYTQPGVTNYWVGPIAQNPLGTADTQLNITDLRYVKPKSVLDRTNYRPLGSILEQPISAKLNFADGTARPGRPAVWRQDEATPNVLNIYPAPDNQGDYDPQPEPPICTISSGGTLPARFYFVTVTFVDTLGGESTAPMTAQIFVPANMLLTVSPPQEPTGASSTGIKYDRYNVYATSSGTNEQAFFNSTQTTKQASNISTLATWTEPTTGLTTTGGAPPGSSTIASIGGYLIEFRYFRQIAQITSAGQTLQIPDDYKHVFIAGVNSLAFQYLFRAQEAQAWEARYQQGMQKIVRDLNFMSKVGDFIGPDAASIGGFLPTLETLDLSLLTP